ncbi:uncharacterized protein LOC122369981 [Amphibalanus amphitrite]|uniref:uncharacterized protein LOC122369981 n=1 Tax=Amphibalanus amphitrite TaxID=1232801 RepID=UPI001C91538A|nr:uncharacterized protein LOC122369981 [Amphibalanus amphitrite]
MTDSLVSVLTSQEEVDQARLYQAEADRQHEEAVSLIEVHLKERKDDPPSVTSKQASDSAASDKTSASRLAEIEAKVKQLELEQLQQRLETEKEEQQIQRKMKLQEAKDAHAAAELRAQLARAAEDDLAWDRRNDFCGETKVWEAQGAPSEEAGSTHLSRAIPPAARAVQGAATVEVAGPSRPSHTISPAVGAVQGVATVEEVGSSRPSHTISPAVGAVQGVATVEEAGSSRPSHTISPAVGAAQGALGADTADLFYYSHVPPPAVGAARGAPTTELAGQFRPTASDAVARGAPCVPSLLHNSLPRLTLPKFGGEPAEWPKWWASFKVLVHEQISLSPTEKLIHLQASVVGTAKLTISGMMFDGALYEEAVHALQDRFGRQEDVVHAYLQEIFSCPAPSQLDPVGLERLHASVHCAVMIFRSLGYDGDLNSFENLRRVVQRLPSEMKRLWGEYVLNLGERPTLVHFDEWLRRQVRVALNYAAVSPQQNMATGKKPAGQPQRWKGDVKPRPVQRSALATEIDTSGTTCVCCKEQHEVTTCPIFLKKSVDERAHFIASARCCFFCLKAGHGVRHCRSARPCGIDSCKMRHHQVLHGSKRVDLRKTGQRVVAAASVKAGATTTLLQVVPVTVLASGGKEKQVWALLDPGSQTSLVSEEVMTQLNLQGEPQTLRLQNVEGCGRLQNSVKMKLELKASGGDGSRIVVPEVFSVRDINVTVPELPDKRIEWKHLLDLDLPDCSGKRVDLLLGANVLEAVLQLEARTGKAGQPVAIRTAFGWTLTGTVKGFLPERTRQVMLIRKMAPDDQMSAALQEWWSTESFGSRFEGQDAKSPQDVRAVKIMEDTTRRLDNRYETGLLWMSDDVCLPDNKMMAANRLYSLEKTLMRQSEKAEAYKKVVEGYVERGFARKLTPEEDQEAHPRKWYLPHHGVTNPRKPGKLRVVFDAAAKCGNTSLNDVLLTGPDLLKNLPGILLRFREEPVALTADIECMYHQVQITPQDQPALRFLWRDLDATKQPEPYTMQVAIFGARSSPASANFVLQQTAKDCSSSTPAGRAAREAALTSFYMDDFVHATRTEEEAAEMQTEVTELLRRGGFRLTKWMSSSRKVLERIEAAERVQDIDVAVQSVLGCAWNTINDTLGVRAVDSRVPSTKRGVVQGVARLFDPLGLVAPFSLQAKVLIQRLWAGNYDWDDELEGTELQRWSQWLSELHYLERVTVPRCFGGASASDGCQRELHIFCDASQDAFGAAAYVATTMPDGRRVCSLAMAKTRVAPLKQISIVRLELQAAVLGVRVANVLRTELSVRVDRVLFWTDSTVVLQYVKNDSRRFHTFVANRVAELRESSCPDQWRHVPSSLNAADVVSRGATLSDLSSDSRWSAGPGFLLQEENCWPEQPSLTSTAVLKNDPEVRTESVMLTVKHDSDTTVLPDASRFSSWTKYRRTVAWVLRFVKNCAPKSCQERADWRRAGPLSAEELKQAETKVLKDCQARCFAEELAEIQAGKEVKTEGKLRQVTPFLDGEGVMRVGGRIDKAPVAYSTRHPVILPSRDDVTRLVVTHCHVKVLHSGQERTLTEVRKTYWILKARSTVRRILHECTVCKRRRAIAQVPRMAELPASRYDTSRAFSTVGVDYFGPMFVKKYRRTEKRYGVLFTCFSTRAVHLEVANALDTDSFVMALRRFMARRGKPDSMYSDNGTNLVGGERELRESLHELDQTRITDELSQENIKWTFMPPSASHMGGVWERLVGSVKRALRVTIGSQCVTDEVLHTALLEVESMVNGRPLTHVSPDSTDVEPLTPNHLLLGCASANMSPGIFQDREISSKRRWRQSQVLAEHFWKRWRNEYVPTLASRQKWLRERRNLKVEDVVLMIEADSPRGFWPLARVTRVFPGSDGVVRTVELMAAGGGKYRRPVSKVCLLEEAE